MIRTLQEKKAQQRVNDFIEFAAQGKWENMETMLKNNKVTVDGRNWDSRTALHIAVCEGRLRIVERLVSESWAQTVSSYGHFSEQASQGHPYIQSLAAASLEVSQAGTFSCAVSRRNPTRTSTVFLSKTRAMPCVWMSLLAPMFNDPKFLKLVYSPP